MIPVNTRGELAPVTTPAPGQPTENPALAVAIAPQMQNVNMPDDPRGTKRRREEESPEAEEPVLKAARVDSDEDSEDDSSTNTLFDDLEELYLQIRDGNAAMVAEILKRSLQLLDAQFHVDGGWTPLCEAANTGRLDMVHLLVSLGSSINAHAECGLTPLMLASKKDDAEMISALCGLGADPLQIDPSTGWDALTYAISYKHLEACKSLIFNGAKITRLLKLPDAPDTHDTYFTPALVAIKADFVELIEWCIDRGDLLPNTYVGNNQTTLLGFAAAEGVVSVVKSLVRRGVMPDGSHARR
ncbi:MAG: ankyrin repeat domain-containing protein, partial [Oxalobacteraceae bacterium]|nr:ankyrin repeat domain-containing protein [Oxalobacteraceae bacterium]